jgi:hypothetical protein
MGKMHQLATVQLWTLCTWEFIHFPPWWSPCCHIFNDTKAFLCILRKLSDIYSTICSLPCSSSISLAFFYTCYAVFLLEGLCTVCSFSLDCYFLSSHSVFVHLSLPHWNQMHINKSSLYKVTLTSYICLHNTFPIISGIICLIHLFH